MTPAIQQRVRFNASPARLFKLYMDSRQHSVATHAKAVVSRRPGGRFSAFDGMITGKMLAIVPNRMIVQAWRAKHWKKTDLDSVLVLTFSKITDGTQVDLVHVNVPEHDHDGVKKGWAKYYWKPWRAYLAPGTRKSRAR
ncbi:MAG TPA: SRPBCC family protein [archaeon]|nr:SRPBCC family protein [archaeon]